MTQTQRPTRSGSRHIVFTTLAMNQTLFFAGLASELKKLGYTSSIITFHQRSVEYIKSQGIDVYDIYEYLKPSTTTENFEQKLELICKRYGVENLNKILSHEKFVFNIPSTRELEVKFCQYLEAIEKIFDEIEKNARGEVILCQELGGFISLVASLYVARRRGINNLFMEPSFFRGRVFLTLNTLKAPEISDNLNPDEVSPEVKKYLKETLAGQAIVIPEKDRNQYIKASQKILNIRNLKRLYEKAFDKHILGKKEEFRHIGNYVGKHVQMLLNSLRLKKYYTSIPTKKYFYYPLHVPHDMALTIRSPEYFDQYSLIDFILRNLPSNFYLAIKEHPALVGAVDFYRIQDLLQKYDNLRIMTPSSNNFELMKRASTVITVNSKSGAEALLCGARVIVLGDAFYRKSRSVHAAEDLQELPSLIQNVVRGPGPSPQLVESFFESAWRRSYPGEIFSSNDQKISEFARSLDSYFSQSYSQIHPTRPTPEAHP